MSRRFIALVLMLATLLVLVSGCAPAADGPAEPAEGGETSGEPAEIRWFIGLGTGSEPEQVAVEEEVIARFNEANPGIVVDIEAVSFDASRDTLATEIASGNPPDVVGPVGILGAEAFRGQWLDLTPLIEETGYDLSQFDPAAVELFSVGGQGQVGLPIALYPSVVFYQRDMFDEAGLNYPPQTYGEPYIWPDGTEAEWNFDTYREVAMLLTVDVNGLDATQEGFDPDQIVQYGFDLPFPDVRYVGNYFGSGTFIGDDGETVVIPDQWVDGWTWYYNGIWEDHFIPSGPVRDSSEYGAGYPFNVNRTATTLSHLWYLCCIADADNWDIAVVPSHNGVTTANIHADTFRILEDSDNPDAAFEAMTYLVGDASTDLLPLYGGLPARLEDQATYFDSLDEQWPYEVNWQVAADGVEFADSPNNESWLPNTQESLDYLGSVMSRWLTTPGLDMDEEVDTLQQELQAIWDREG